VEVGRSVHPLAASLKVLRLPDVPDNIARRGGGRYDHAEATLCCRMGPRACGARRAAARPLLGATSMALAGLLAGGAALARGALS
jgi:hypothetical protein